MAKPEHVKIKVEELYQACIVVRDLERSITHYQNILGIGPWETLNVDPSIATDMTYRGKPAKHRFRAAFTMVGPMQIELIQPVEGENIFSDFLKEHGEGVQHLGHVRVKNLSEAIRIFEEEGFPCIQSGRVPEYKSGYAFIDTVKALGVITELIESPEGPSAFYPPSLWKVWQRQGEEK